MFDENRLRSAWVRARTDCEIAHLSYDRLEELARVEPEVVFAMLSQLSLRVRDTSRKLGDLAFKDVTGRIARAVLDLSQLPEAMATPAGRIVKITRQELARIVGCSREMASRVVRNLEDQHMVSVSWRKILIHRTGGLDHA